MVNVNMLKLLTNQREESIRGTQWLKCGSSSVLLQCEVTVVTRFGSGTMQGHTNSRKKPSIAFNDLCSGQITPTKISADFLHKADRFSLSSQTANSTMSLERPLLSAQVYDSNDQRRPPTTERSEPMWQSLRHWSGSVVSFAMAAVISFQFVIAFRNHHPDTALLSATSVGASIAALVVISALYRYACHEMQVQSVAVQVLPEILMDAVALAVVFNRVYLGFALVLASTFLLSLIVAVVILVSLCREDVVDEEEEEIDLLEEV